MYMQLCYWIAASVTLLAAAHAQQLTSHRKHIENATARIVYKHAATGRVCCNHDPRRVLDRVSTAAQLL
jgi:hypothetical protein